MALSDPAEALVRLKRLEPDAVDRLYRDHAGDVLGWAIRLGGHRLDAEDVAHQVFEVALARLPTFRGESTLRTWLYGITRRVVANARRKAAFWSFVSLEGVLRADPGPDPEYLSQQQRERRLVQQALEVLPDKQREVLVLLDLEERPAPEVAEMLGVPVGTIYSRSHGARRAFADALGRLGLTADTVAAIGGAR